jgi:hypothetical protein
MAHDFRIYFNRKRQWADCYLHNIHPKTFQRRGGGRWGYFQNNPSSPRVGLFGELHFVRSRIRFDVVVHELEHLRVEWMWARGETITRKNEEKMTSFLDELCRKFVRELRKKEPNITL